ncbi:diguanylate cyclase [Marinobacter sp. ATCH36]|uniref:sensor domain-containing diguanylate cyclase n=1 Tax=Marinobacter sp. ATCH36 TaxID=2945106 RepID=UPI002021432C|nr:diguanylate cyclase [Marinobacter sp. ATCH36]MCL7942491.1 diguanylate cyclase [Marinobacter sp. ATCH36]
MPRFDDDGAQSSFPDLFPKLASGVPGVLFIYQQSADGLRYRYPFVSDRVRTLFGLEPEDLHRDGQVVSSVIHPEDIGGVAASITESARKLTPWQHQARMRLVNGDYHWFESDSVPELQADGSVLWYGQFNDIQPFKDLEFSLRESEAEFSFQAGFQKLIARLSSDFITCGFGNIDQSINRVLEAIGQFFGVDRAYLYRISDQRTEMTNTHEWSRDGVEPLIDTQQQVPIDTFTWWHQQIDQMVETNRLVFVENVAELPEEAGPEKALLTKQGVCSMFCVPVRTRGMVSGFFGVDSLSPREWRTDQADLLIIVSGLLSGVLERHRLEEELLNQSIRDPLTGLHNRRYLYPRLDEMIALWNREQQPFALALFDIDHFKVVNDTLGHLAGDYVLREFTGILLEHTRAMDVVARFGGEEFVVAFSATDSDAAGALVNRIIKKVRHYDFVVDGQKIPLTVSAGVAAVGGDDAADPTPEMLIGSADNRLYLAKEAGRDCFANASGPSRL